MCSPSFDRALEQPLTPICPTGFRRGSLDLDADDLSIISHLSTDYTYDSQPRICFDQNCTFPMGAMCQACEFDRAERLYGRSKRQSYQRAKSWIEEVNVQKYITQYTGTVFVGRAANDTAEIEEQIQKDLASDTESEDECYNEDEESVEETDPDQPSGQDVSPISSHPTPKSFVSNWDVGPPSSSSSQTQSLRTVVSSRISSVSPVNLSFLAVSSNNSIRSGSSAYVEPWTSDICNRTRELTMDDKIFVGGAEDDPKQEICPLCKNAVGDPTFQHVLRCQFAHDEKERMGAALWRIGC